MSAKARYTNRGRKLLVLLAVGKGVHVEHMPKTMQALADEGLAVLRPNPDFYTGWAWYPTRSGRAMGLHIAQFGD